MMNEIQMPKVSIIIPSYNSAQYIVETLQSVFAQTYKNYEIIVVDDGSIDNTKEVLRPYMGKITYIYKENGGPASARNVGIKHAQGEYIAFLDSDDTWLPEKLEKQVDYLKKHPEIGLVFTDCVRFDEKGLEEQRSKKYPLFKENYTMTDLFWGNFIPTLTVMTKREYLKEVGYFDENPKIQGSEDYDLWIRIAQEFKICYISQALAKYRVSFKGHNRSDIDRSYLSYIFALEKNFPFMRKENCTKTKTQAKMAHRKLAQLYSSWGESHFNLNRFSEAKDKLLISLGYQFSFKCIILLCFSYLKIRPKKLLLKFLTCNM